MAESIKVAVRVRPLTYREIDQNSSCVLSVQGPAVTVLTSPPKSFTCDFSFWSADPDDPNPGTQEMVMADIGTPMVENALKGYNSTVFAYGQTGTGKSFTVMGFPQSPGLVPRMIEALFIQKAKLNPKNDELRIWIAFMELYNERIRDLLHPDEKLHEPQIADDPELGSYVPGLTETLCEKTADVHKLMDFGTKRRVIASTNMNATSSRSHVVFTIRLQRLTGIRPAEGKRDDRKVMSAKLNLIDLAGSERLGRTGSDGFLQQEGYAINQSLMALGFVVREVCKLQERARRSPKSVKLRDQVPFGASKLTLLLRDALIGNSKTYMLATMSPASTSLDETLSTLRFASSLRRIRTFARATTGRRDDLASGLQADVKRLRREYEAHPDDPVPAGAQARKMALQEEIAERERLLGELRRPSQAGDRERQLEAARDALFKDLGVTEEDFSEAKGIDMNVPYLLNMNEDPALAGCIMYFLPNRVCITIGAHPQNKIVLQGLGIPEHLCSLENVDHQEITIFMPSPENGTVQKARVCVNGRALRLRPDERHKLKHNDKLYFGRATAMRLIVPETARALGKADSMALTEDINEADLTRSLAVEDSRAWGELQLYLEDLWQRLGEERGRELFDHLSEASHLVDEANEITAELRPNERMKFEVELVWDIHRDARDIIVIRLLQYKPTSNPTLSEHEPWQMGDEVDGMTVLSYWTLSKFKVRLDQMRDCYDRQHHHGGWGEDNESNDDPWSEPSIVELRRHMYADVDVERQRRYGSSVPIPKAVAADPPPLQMLEQEAPPGRPVADNDNAKSRDKVPVRSRSRSRTRSPSASMPGGSMTSRLDTRSKPSASASPPPQQRQVNKPSPPALALTAPPSPAIYSSNASQDAGLTSSVPSPPDLTPLLEGAQSTQSTDYGGGSLSAGSRLSAKPGAGFVSQDELISTLQEQLKDKDDKIELYELRIASLQQQINLYENHSRRSTHSQEPPALVAVVREANSDALTDRMASWRESSMRSGSSALREASTSVGREASVRSDTSTARRSVGVPAAWSPVQPLSPGSPSTLTQVAQTPMSPLPTPVYIPDVSVSRGRTASVPRWATPPQPAREAAAPRWLSGPPHMFPAAATASPAKITSRVIRTASPLRSAQNTPLGGAVSWASPLQAPMSGTWPEGTVLRALPRPTMGHALSSGRPARHTTGSARSVEELFDRIDLNKDGLISREEFRQALAAPESAAAAVVPPIALPSSLGASFAESPQSGHGRAHRIIFTEQPPLLARFTSPDLRSSLPSVLKHGDRSQEPPGMQAGSAQLKPAMLSAIQVAATAPTSATRVLVTAAPPAPLPANALAGPELVQHGSVQLPIMQESHLRALHPAMAREHALLLQRTIGHERTGVVPVADHELQPWILSVQRSHLEHLRCSPQTQLPQQPQLPTA